MSTRRHARECALQALFQIDATGEGDIESALAKFWQSFQPDPGEEREFADRLVLGVVRYREEIDGLIQGASTHWRLARMARVDRNILRLAAYEIRFLPDVPKKVAINEALEIAKRFSAEGSVAFINGILDNLEPCEKDR